MIEIVNIMKNQNHNIRYDIEDKYFIIYIDDEPVLKIEEIKKSNMDWELIIWNNITNIKEL